MKEEEKTEETITIEEYSTEGIPPEFHQVIAEYGRSMYATLINAGVANETSMVLKTIVAKHQSRHGQEALFGLINAFNQLNTAYVAQMGWEDERMQACNKEISAVIETQILAAPAAILGPDGQVLKH